MKPFDNLVRKMRQELVELAMKKENLSDIELVRKSQELDELMNCFYSSEHGQTKSFITHTRKTIYRITREALRKKGLLDKSHTLKLKKLCFAVGVKIGLPPYRLVNLGRLTFMHNLGMLLVPTRILFKEEALTSEELHLIRQHPEKGYRIAICLGESTEMANLILKHREHWDGSGYPLGLKGKEIPVECRIFSVAEAYNNIVGCGHYRQVVGIENALAKLRSLAGIQFDPRLVDVLFELAAKDRDTDRLTPKIGPEFKVKDACLEPR